MDGEFRVDNMAVVQVVNFLFCSDSNLMHLVRLLIFFAPYHNFWFLASQIEGRYNATADALSHNNLHTFFLQAPQASRTPSRIPQPLLSINHSNITWTSISWTKLFFTILQQLWPCLHTRLTKQQNAAITNSAKTSTLPRSLLLNVSCVISSHV